MLGGRPTGGVSSRFVSQTELEEAAKNRASAGGTPAAGSQDTYDPRSLFEQLQAHKTAKDEEYDDMYKLSNQFRGIDEGESDFLSQVNQQKRQEERQKKQQEEQELQQFRQARHTSTAGPSTLSPPSKPAAVLSPTPESSLATASETAAKPSASSIPGPTSAQTGGSSTNSGNKKKRKAAGSSLLGVVKKKPASTTASTAKASITDVSKKA